MLDSNLLNALKLGFSSSVQKIKIPSLGDPNREYSFREPNVKEVNTISKVVLSNSDSQSTIYASTLVLLKYLCLDDDFNPYMMNEIDRLKLITYILSGIFFSKNLTVKCPKIGCGTTFPFSIKYGDILRKIDDISSVSFKFENSTSAGNATITAGFPRTQRYLDFLEFVDGIKNKTVDYDKFNSAFVEIDSTNKASDMQHSSSSDSNFKEKIKKRREILSGKISKSVKNDNTILGNVDIKKMGNDKQSKIDIDMSYLYIKNMTITNIPNSTDDYNIEFEGLSFEDANKILDVIPMRLFVKEDDESNFIHFVGNEISKLLNKCSPEIICPTCKHNISKNIGIQNFFIHG